MAQGSRQIQSQAQQQVQTLSPQQILVVKLLELPAVERKTVSMLNCLKIRHLKKVKKRMLRIMNIPIPRMQRMAWIAMPMTMIL